MNSPDEVLQSPEVSKAAAELLDVRSCIVHTDGSCEPNPGIGGWGVSFDVAGRALLELSGGEIGTTNNRMEMTAALVALAVLSSDCRVTILSDSQYLIKGMTIWLEGWKRKGFRRGEGHIPNADLWMKLDELAAGRAIKWRWVRGHNGHAGNERADHLAEIGRSKALQSAACGHSNKVAQSLSDDLQPDPSGAIRKTRSTACFHALQAMEQKCWTVRCIDIPTGAGDADIGWEVVEHHMAPPKERVVGYGSTPLVAIQDAMSNARRTKKPASHDNANTGGTTQPEGTLT